MEEIVKTTRYWLFKKTKSGEYYYVRIKTDNIDEISWSIGYKNRFGLVSLVGGELNHILSQSLENEFQIEIDKNRKEILNYKVKL